MAKTQEELREYAREYARKRRASDPLFLEKCREAGRKSREKHREERLKQASEWKSANKDKVEKYRKEYYEKNKEDLNAKLKIRRIEKKKEYALVSKAWREKNKDQIKKFNRTYTANRYKNDPIFALKLNQRTRVRAILKNDKSAKTHELLGCSFEQLKQHIESLFKEGMTWHNMGEWHIDHIIPLAAFDLSKSENQRIAFNYKNLQPLWAIENLKKGAKRA